ncbi:hypothetical protein [Kitasatospora sp. NPDC093806]|uniref:hypothetical protein n=1 Tax=Kitasatospora sp. NPDC093806 TaxID=3155075 RepID=UPI003439D5A8
MTGALWITAAVLLTALCYLLLAVLLPGDIERRRDYTAATACPTATAEQTVEDCLRTVPFTVEKTVLTGGKQDGYQARLQGSPFWNGTLRFGDAGPLLDKLTPGEPVTGLVWRGAVMRLERDGVRQSSVDEPRDEAQITAGVGTLAGLLAALALYLGALYLGAAQPTGRPGGTSPTWRSFGKPMALTVLLACAVTALPAFWLDLPWWTVPAVAVPLSALVGRLLHRAARQPVLS